MRARVFAYFALPLSVLVAANCGGEAFTSSGGSSGDGDIGDGDGDIGDGDGDIGDGDGDATGGQSGTGGRDGTGGETSGSGGESSVDRECFSSYDCELVGAGCCPACGEPTLSDVTAVTRGQSDEHYNEVCGGAPQPCPACATALNPNLFAECVEGTCRARDLREHRDAACSGNEDCKVTPAACCECGAGKGPGEIVATNQDPSDFVEAQCDTTPVCDACLWEPPPGITTSCVEGFCRLNPPPMMQ